jgi:DNA-binding Lrp family transcriptional regulator
MSHHFDDSSDLDGMMLPSHRQQQRTMPRSPDKPLPAGDRRPDAQDRQLLALLQTNARQSTADLARQLGLARTTVLARLARLEREGVIVGYTVRLAADQDDAGVQAYVGLVVSAKAARTLVLRLAALPELRQLCSVSGEFDYLALLRASSPARLDALLDEIGEMEGVVKTHTSVVLAQRIDRRA